MKTVPVISKTMPWALLWVILASCSGKNQQPGGPVTGPVAYKVAPVYAGKATLHYTFPTTIEGEQDVEIRPKVDGFIQKIYVDEGDIVRKGQPLFRLNNPQYEQAVRSATAAVKIAEANVLTASMDVDKIRPLVQNNIISNYELQSNEYLLTSRKASLASVKAELTNARVNVGYTYITSPTDGVIGAIPYKIGSLVSSTIGNPLTTVYNTKKVYAYYSMNEKQLLEFSRRTKGNNLQQKLATLQDVSLVLADGSEYPHKGRVTTASGLISTETGSANLRATFPNPEGLIRSGSSANIKIPFTLDSALLIPQEATFDLQGKKFVYKLVGQDSITNVAINVDELTLGDLYVVRQGLSKADKIVIEGAGNIPKSTRIKPVLTPPDRVYQAIYKK